MLHLLLTAIVMGATPAFAGTVALHVSQAQDKVQNRAGGEAPDPLSFGISAGPHYRLSDKWVFAPELGYIKNEVRTSDPYGGKPKIETIYLLYDFTRSLNGSGSVNARLGLGTFMKRIKGSGGTVTVPNGAGTSTAYKPGGTRSSYTGSINLGVEWFFAKSDASDLFERYRVFTELFVFDPLFEPKRLVTLQIGIGANL